jgi:hypothetical protein
LALQGCDQLGHPNGFGDVVVHAGLQAFGAVVRQGMGGDRDNRDARIDAHRVAAPNSAGQLVPVNHRHLAIHQHGVVGPMRQTG